MHRRKETSKAQCASMRGATAPPKPTDERRDPYDVVELSREGFPVRTTPAMTDKKRVQKVLPRARFRASLRIKLRRRVAQEPIQRSTSIAGRFRDCSVTIAQPHGECNPEHLQTGLQKQECRNQRQLHRHFREHLSQNGYGYTCILRTRHTKTYVQLVKPLAALLQPRRLTAYVCNEDPKLHTKPRWFLYAVLGPHYTCLLAQHIYCHNMYINE